MNKTFKELITTIAVDEIWESDRFRITYIENCGIKIEPKVSFYENFLIYDSDIFTLDEKTF